MKVNCKVLSLVCLLLLFITSCKEEDDNAEDLSNVVAEILLTAPNEILSTDFINFDVSLSNGSGVSTSYKTIKWVLDKSDGLVNSKHNDLYFLSADHQKITCEVTLSDNSVITKSVELNVVNDPKGNWSLNSSYTDAGTNIFTPDKLVLETPNFITYPNTGGASKKLSASGYAEQGLRELNETFNQSELAFYGKVIIGHDKDGGSGFVSSFPSYSMYVGMAEHVSNSEIPAIWQKVTDWQNNTEGNPVSIQEQPIGTSSNDGDYYPMSGLSVTYLLDPTAMLRRTMTIKTYVMALKAESLLRLHFKTTLT